MPVARAFQPEICSAGFPLQVIHLTRSREWKRAVQTGNRQPVSPRPRRGRGVGGEGVVFHHPPARHYRPLPVPFGRARLLPSPLVAQPPCGSAEASPSRCFLQSCCPTAWCVVTHAHRSGEPWAGAHGCRVFRSSCIPARRPSCIGPLQVIYLTRSREGKRTNSVFGFRCPVFGWRAADGSPRVRSLRDSGSILAAHPGTAVPASPECSRLRVIRCDCQRFEFGLTSVLPAVWSHATP